MEDNVKIILDYTSITENDWVQLPESVKAVIEKLVIQNISNEE